MSAQPAKRLEQVGEYYFSQKLEIIRRMRLQGQDVINLGIGSPDLAPAPAVITAATQALQQEKNHGYASYRSSPELRAAMADWYQRTYGVTLNAENEILPLLGSKEGILYISLAFLNPGDKVLVPNPGYPAYASVSALMGAEIVYYDLQEESGWLPDFSQLNKQDLSSCKLMWVNYPHMPTGQVGSAELFSQLAAFGKKKKILICNDNPYGLVLNRTPPLSLITADPAKEWVLELNSLSKSFNMAGWRVGMLLAAAEVVNSVLQVKSNVDSGMFLPVQAGAAAALRGPDAWHESRNAVYRERRDLVLQLFDRLGFSVAPHQVGLFQWARVPESIPDVEAWVDHFLAKAHIFLTPGFIFGSNGKRYVRASLCADRKVLQEALQRLEGLQL